MQLALLTKPPFVSSTRHALRIFRRKSRPSKSNNYASAATSANLYLPSGEKRPSGMALKLLSIVQKHGLEILA
eukprot:gene17737-21203_t